MKKVPYSSIWLYLISVNLKKNTILVLYSDDELGNDVDIVWQPAMVVNSAGEQEELKCFKPDSKTETYYSCSVNWKNQLFIFGGRTERRQISRLTGHRLKRVGNLTFDFYDGACDVKANQYLFLCFGDDSKDYKQCRRSTGHLRIQISCSDSK